MRDGGPAFACLEVSNGVLRLTSQMSLRDYFAAEAMRSVAPATMDYLVDMEDDEKVEQLAMRCYFVADAMLKARQTNAT